jgi:protein O-GlcNAc transferase
MRVGWMTLAQMQRDSRDLDAAIDSMRRAHALAPRDAQTTSLLAAYLTERGRAAEAIALLTPAASDDRADVQVLVTLGLAQAQAGRGAEAIETIERARRADPTNHRLLIELGTVQLVANRHEDARKTFELAVARNPRLARAHSSLAAIHVEDGRTVEAIASWREATRLDPSEYGRIFLLGISLARAQKTAAARTCLAFFAENAPTSAYAREISAARAWLGR